jgi:hypothetical protein
MAVIGFVAAFWAGSYQPWLTGPDFDIVFGSFVLGNAVWLGVVPARGHGVAATVVFLSFPVACFLWQFVVLGVVLYLGETPDLQASTSLHSAYWISVGVSMGLLGGLIGGPALRRMLTSRPS